MQETALSDHVGLCPIQTGLVWEPAPPLRFFLYIWYGAIVEMEWMVWTVSRMFYIASRRAEAQCDPVLFQLLSYVNLVGGAWRGRGVAENQLCSLM